VKRRLSCFSAVTTLCVPASPEKWSKSSIKVEIDSDNRIEVDFHVIVSYGVSISTVADNLIENVKYKVSS
jgi:uncharacterized alkaline shock family protein YloU